MMQFKKGNNWEACFDEDRGLYTAQVGSGVNNAKRTRGQVAEGKRARYSQKFVYLHNKTNDPYENN